MTVKNEENFQTAVKKMIQSAELEKGSLEIEFKLTLCDKVPLKAKTDKQIMDSQNIDLNSSWLPLS